VAIYSILPIGLFFVVAQIFSPLASRANVFKNNCTCSDTQIVRQKYLITTDGSEWKIEECGPHGPSRLSDTEVDLGMHVHA